MVIFFGTAGASDCVKDQSNVLQSSLSNHQSDVCVCLCACTFISIRECNTNKVLPHTHPHTNQQIVQLILPAFVVHSLP
uniref:Uncharacterized protein n=1 Tax=Anopheles arabiensis TaxID=7173 RepID=A0A182IHD4_ANOAR